jgi:paraquat-inducible protein B
MSKPVNKTVIGLFVVVALALVVAAILILGSGKFFKHNPKFVMYFQGSVKGLSVGSPVIFRGVKVGTVTEIKMLFNPKDLSIMIPVYVELEEGSLETEKGGQGMGAYSTQARRSLHIKDFARELIKRGLRAQLEMQSIVTGQLMVSLDFYPEKPATLVGADHRYVEIPTIQTPLQELANRVSKLPIEEILQKVNGAMGGIEKIVNSPETLSTIEAIRQAVNDTRSLVQNLDNQVNPLATRMTDVATHLDQLATRLESQIEPLASSVTKTSDEAKVTLKKAQAAMGTIEDLTGEDSVVSYHLAKTLDELGSAARSLRQLADTLQHQPDAIIFGKKNTGGK